MAADDFRFIATMNPGGDFGKRELSPALRNRFTEIWVPALGDLGDLRRVVEERLLATAKQVSVEPDTVQAAALAAAGSAAASAAGLSPSTLTDGEVVEALTPFIKRMLWFVRWFNTTTSAHLTPASVAAAADAAIASGDARQCTLPGVSDAASGALSAGALATGPSTRALSFTVRDIVAWVAFVVRLLARTPATPWQAYMHGAAMVMLDGIGLGTGLSHAVAKSLQAAAYRVLHAQAPAEAAEELAQVVKGVTAAVDGAGAAAPAVVEPVVTNVPGAFGMQPFLIATGNEERKQVQYVGLVGCASAGLRSLGCALAHAMLTRTWCQAGTLSARRRRL